MPISTPTAVRPEKGELKMIRATVANMPGIVKKQALKGWHVADGKNGTENLINQFPKFHGISRSQARGGSSTITPSGSVQGRTLSVANMAVHGHGVAGLNVERNREGHPINGDYPSLSGQRSRGINVNSRNAGSNAAHNHALSMHAFDNQPQHICVVPFQYTGRRIRL